MANTSRHSGIRRNKPTRVIKNEPALIGAIRSRAYALYESRGREDGHELDDWLLAEQQVLRPAVQTKQPSAA